MKKRIAILAVGLSVLAMHVVALFPVGPTASAISQAAMIEDAEQYSYYAAVEDCILQGNLQSGPINTGIDTSKPTNQWMRTRGSGVTVGFTIPNNAGKGECNEVFAAAINAFGYSSNPTGFLADMLGYRQGSGSTWVDARNDNVTPQEQLTREARRRGIPTGETNAIVYQLSYDALISGRGCAATAASGGTLVTLITDEAGGTKQVRYQFDGGEKVNAYPRAGNFNNPSVNCDTVARTLDERAKALAIDMVNDANNNARSVFIRALQDNLCPNGTPDERANHAGCVEFYRSATTTCFNAMINDNDFTFPSYNINTLAGCIASRGGDLGRITSVLRAASASATPSTTAFADRVPPGGTTNNDPVCAGGMLGWIICPLISVMQSAIQSAAGLMDGMLRLDPLDRTTGGGSIYNLWRSVLNIANIILVIAFLIVIFSQATSVGLSSYGIKKILPRIIAAAILMNLSFFICQVMVDLSNIIGASAAQLVQSVTGTTSFSSAVTERVSGLERVVAGGIAIAIIVFFFLIPVLLSFLAVFFTIAARFALVILLVLVAPLAFAAWVLPNTEKYFQKWWGLFFNLLMLYPIIMFVFAAALIASQAVGSASQ